MNKRRLSKKSGLTIPKDIRAEAGLLPGMAVDIEVDDQNQVIIRKHTESCRFCGSLDGVKLVMGMEICQDCAANVLAEYKMQDWVLPVSL